MTHHEDDKKKKVRERNRRMWQIFTQTEQMLDKVDVAAAVVVARAPEQKAATRKAEEAIDMHLVTIRNRINSSRRKSDDRWNRFAGTSGGGGRGR